MRIESYDMQMQSQHSFSMEIEKEISFSTMLLTPQQQEVDLIPETKSFDANRNISDMLRTIDEIIQSLMGMLQKKAQDAQVSQEVPVISLYDSYTEHETLNLSTIGKIQTDQGCIDLDLNFNMSRDFAIENRIDIFDSFDPLVLNFDGSLPNLSQKTFSFDLDNDGESEQISELGLGSGFLALDKNDDGIINQGSELFGTISGDGFDELREYDLDLNHWIDENDSIFDKLRIWFKNEDSNEKELVGLGEMGVGAIFLGSASSEFTYKTSMNQTLGTMKSSGIFLGEDGSCGNISQIDFSAKKEQPLAELLQA